MRHYEDVYWIAIKLSEQQLQVMIPATSILRPLLLCLLCVPLCVVLLILPLPRLFFGAQSWLPGSPDSSCSPAYRFVLVWLAHLPDHQIAYIVSSAVATVSLVLFCALLVCRLASDCVPGQNKTGVLVLAVGLLACLVVLAYCIRLYVSVRVLAGETHCTAGQGYQEIAGYLLAMLVLAVIVLVGMVALLAMSVSSRGQRVKQVLSPQPQQELKYKQNHAEVLQPTLLNLSQMQLIPSKKPNPYQALQSNATYRSEQPDPPILLPLTIARPRVQMEEAATMTYPCPTYDSAAQTVVENEDEMETQYRSCGVGDEEIWGPSNPAKSVGNKGIQIGQQQAPKELDPPIQQHEVKAKEDRGTLPPHPEVDEARMAQYSQPIDRRKQIRQLQGTTVRQPHRSRLSQRSRSSSSYLIQAEQPQGNGTGQLWEALRQGQLCPTSHRH